MIMGTVTEVAMFYFSEQQSLAIGIISGQIVQLPLVLVIMPVRYHTMHRKKKRSEAIILMPSRRHDELQ